MNRYALLRITVLLAVTGLLAAACGGSATVTPVPSVAAPASLAPASLAPTPLVPAASPIDNTVPSASPVAAIPSFDLSKLGGTLPGVDSYRTSFTVGGALSYQSVVVTKPVVAKSITAYDSDGKTVSSRFVIIGDQAWTADGPTGAFSVLPSGAAAGMMAAFDPSAILSVYAKLNFASVASNQGTETKNGVSAQHLRIDSSSALGLAAAIPAGASIDIWVADAGYLVAWEMTGFPNDQNVLIEVTNFNDPTNAVTAPAA